MHVFGIRGSPRPAEVSLSTRLLRAGLAAFAEAGWTTGEFDLPGAGIAPCRSCGACAKTGQCPYGDAAGEFHQALLAAEAVILASPVYFYSLPAQVKAVVDRAQAYWQRRFVLGDTSFLPNPPPPLIFLAVAGGPPAQRLFTGSELVITAWANTMGLDWRESVHVTESDSLDAAGLEDARTRIRDAAGRISQPR
jgi:hypothetical protein